MLGDSSATRHVPDTQPDDSCDVNHKAALGFTPRGGREGAPALVQAGQVECGEHVAA